MTHPYKEGEIAGLRMTWREWRVRWLAVTGWLFVTLAFGAVTAGAAFSYEHYGRLDAEGRAWRAERLAASAENSLTLANDLQWVHSHNDFELSRRPCVIVNAYLSDACPRLSHLPGAR
jgi:hypothetical protein